MNTTPTDSGQDGHEIFLVTFPGLESLLVEELADLGFSAAVPTVGGVTIRGGWPEVWRANLMVRGASRILVRIAAFRALHLAQLDKRARHVPWSAVLRPDVPVRVEATCKASRIYHAKAAAQRVGRAITEQLGAPVSAEAALLVKVRIDDDLCTISLDTSGELLHRRGHKEAIAKAPLRETMAALFLRRCGFDGSRPVPVVDPMCGAGTLVIEAAEMAAGLAPGRSRTFAFETMASFDAAAWASLRATVAPRESAGVLFHGSDRDPGAIRMSRANAERAGVTAWTEFQEREVAEVRPPDGPPGLVIVNPPYGARIGERKALAPLYRSLGKTLRSRFAGWRVALVTSDEGLAKATDLPLTAATPAIDHGGLRVKLYTSDAL